MAKSGVFNLTGLQLGLSPLLQTQGQFIQLVNVDSNPVGAKKKRPGYISYLNNPDNAQINSLFQFRRNDGTTFNLYRASGSVLYYSTQGTGNWAICGNGTIAAGSPVGFTVLNDTLILGDGVGSTRHSTDGTSFTNTTLAPIAPRFAEYQGRVHAIGTTSFDFYSVVNDPTNWNTSGTSDSSSILIPGGGKLLDVMKVADQLTFSKNNGAMYRWDGYSLVDAATNLAPTSPYSVVNIEDYRLYLNRLGYFGYNGALPKIISNPLQAQIYNDPGSAIVGTTFDNAPGGVYRYSAMWSVGSVTDDLTNETVTNCLQVYNYQLDEWSNYSFATQPTAFVKYKDTSGVDQLLFGDATGQCYLYGGTATSDAGTAIQAVMQFIYHDGAPDLEKEFNYMWLFFNPGCRARVQIAVGDTYVKGRKNWIDLGDVSSGIAEFKFSGQRGRLLFIKVSEMSTDARFSFYGCSVDYDPVGRK